MTKRFLGKYLTYDDVLLVPSYSEILPREVSLGTQLTKKIKLEIPFISAAMDSVTEHKMAIAIGNLGGIGIIHKNMSVEKQAQEVKKVKAKKLLVGAAVGVGDAQERTQALVKAGIDVIVVDSAHGHSKGILDTIKLLKKSFPKLQIIGGNIATVEGAKALIKAGADAVKVGIGPGSICTTRIVAGVGVPQFSAILHIAKALKDTGIPIIADGGLKFSGDIVKALAAGASTVMIGSLLAGTDESPGEILQQNGKKYKIHRGMGSIEAMKQGSADRYGQDKSSASKKLVPEGIVGKVPYKGSVEEIIYQLSGGLRSGMGYCGANLITKLRKAKFMEITAAGLKESHPHSLAEIQQTTNYHI